MESTGVGFRYRHGGSRGCQVSPFKQVNFSYMTLATASNKVTDTCYLAISSTVSVILTWAQIRAAVAALMSVCVQNPFQPSEGGRAYYGTPPKTVAGRGKRKRDSPNGT